MNLRRRNLLLAGAAAPFLTSCGLDDAGAPEDRARGGDPGSLQELSGDHLWRAAGKPYDADLRVIAGGASHWEPAEVAVADLAELTGVRSSWDRAPLEDMHTQLILDMSTQPATWTS